MVGGFLVGLVWLEAVGLWLVYGLLARWALEVDFFLRSDTSIVCLIMGKYLRRLHGRVGTLYEHF